MSEFVFKKKKKKGANSRIYPMNLLFDDRGEIIHFSFGAYSSRAEALKFAELIKGLEK